MFISQIRDGFDHRLQFLRFKTNWDLNMGIKKFEKSQIPYSCKRSRWETFDLFISYEGLVLCFTC